MQAFDVVLRAGTGGLLVGTALLLWAQAPRARLVRYFVPFALCLAGFLARNTPDAALQLSGIAAVVASVLSGVAAVFIWWFCSAVFDDEFRPGPVEWTVAGAWVVLALLDRGVPWPGLKDAGLSWVLVAMGAAMIGGVAWRIVRGLEDDLVEARRRVRVLVAGALAALLVTDFAVDLTLGFAWKPQAFTMVQNAAILAITVAVARWLLRPDLEVLDRPAVAASSPAPVAKPEPSGDPRLRRRLEELIGVERVHLDPDLTFGAFVRRMGAPEATVRDLINRELGHRHFRSFVNAHRVETAKRALADPAGEPKVASVAFDSGFASLASFNRAFKAIAGVAPSDYRQAALSSETRF
ncbi:MAG TPA: AraC family transcriptional regulator [Caulobacteraceae bacterium]|nr:AraC family transcriptional regulator [Caulobacteraceae bacterium]